MYRISWQGYGANFSRMIALQVVIATLSVWLRYFRAKGSSLLGSAVLLLSVPLIWLVIQSQWLHLHMIFDADLRYQRLMILFGEVCFLGLSYFGWMHFPNRIQGQSDLAGGAH